MCVRACVCVCDKESGGWSVLYWKASRNMSTTLMMMSSIMMRNTTTFWVSGGRLQRSMAVKNPILCLLHLPEPLPRAISPLASSSSSSSAPLPLPRRLSLSAEPPHHTASPRPLPRLAPSASSSAAFLLRSAPAGASSASPATLPMPTVAPACQWRLGAYLCQRVWESALCEAIFCITCWASPPPTRPPLLPFSSLRSRHLSSLFSFYSPPVRSFFSFGSFCLSLSQDVRMEDGRQDAASLRFMLMPSRLFLPLLSIVLSPFFSGLIFSQRSLHAFTWLSLSNQPAICSPSDLFSSSPLPPSLPTFSLCEELLLKWCSLLCLELCCLSHPFNYQDHPLFLFFPSSIPSFFCVPTLA